MKKILEDQLRWKERTTQCHSRKYVYNIYLLYDQVSPPKLVIWNIQGHLTFVDEALVV